MNRRASMSVPDISFHFAATTSRNHLSPPTTIASSRGTGRSWRTRPDATAARPSSRWPSTASPSKSVTHVSLSVMCAFTCSSLSLPTVSSMPSQTVVAASRSSLLFPRLDTFVLFARSRFRRSVSPASSPSVDGWCSGASCTGCHRGRSLGSCCLHTELRRTRSEGTTIRSQTVRHREIRRRSCTARQEVPTSLTQQPEPRTSTPGGIRAFAR